MELLRRTVLQMGGCALLAGFGGWEQSAQAQEVTREKLECLIPSVQDLIGFVPVAPKGFVSIRPSSDTPDRSAPVALTDDVDLNVDLERKDPVRTGFMSTIGRGMYSFDERYFLAMRVKVCDSANTARAELASNYRNFLADSSKGTFQGPAEIGDESHYLTDGMPLIVYRYGKTLVEVNGSISFEFRNKEHISFPQESLEAIAQLILLRLARYPELTGLPVENVIVSVNGKTLPKSSTIQLGEMVYVPVREFSNAVGVKMKWNPKTGELALTRSNQTLTLHAGSFSVQGIGPKAVFMKTPVLTEAGQPVMVLKDLMALLGGSITRPDGKDYKVQVND